MVGDRDRCPRLRGGCRDPWGGSGSNAGGGQARAVEKWATEGLFTNKMANPRRQFSGFWPLGPRSFLVDLGTAEVGTLGGRGRWPPWSLHSSTAPHRPRPSSTAPQLALVTSRDAPRSPASVCTHHGRSTQAYELGARRTRALTWPLPAVQWPPERFMEAVILGRCSTVRDGRNRAPSSAVLLARFLGIADKVGEARGR